MNKDRNKLIRLSGKIEGSTLPMNGIDYSIVDKKGFLDTMHVETIKNQILEAMDVWKKMPYTFCDPIISVRQCRVIPKSKRIQYLFKASSKSVNSFVVGVHFDHDCSKLKHVVVYRLPISTLQKSIEKLEQLEKTLRECFDGSINKDQLKLLFGIKPKEKEKIEKRNSLKNRIDKSGMSVSAFGEMVQDVSSIEKVFIDTEKKRIDEPAFVSLFDTGLSPEKLLAEIDLPKVTTRIGTDTDGYSYFLTPAQFEKIAEKYPYLISMSLVDVATLVPEIKATAFGAGFDIPSPTNEPVVGVIDTDFDTRVPFSMWVDYHKNVKALSNPNHGTAISSLIVDGPLLNPKLEDGCGRFRVRHFSVIGEKDRVSQLKLYEDIEHIVRTNRDIKVWNLSLGTEQSIEKNTVSPIGALLDQLQAELDVVFVVAGTNNSKCDATFPVIGSPADSINSIVVNAVDENGNVPDYARRGPVLEFFPGPTLSAIGGSENKPITVFTSHGRTSDYGTSYAACWVTRKIAYLMHKLNLSRETAKALLVDAAYGWNNENDIEKIYLLGAGILPTHISGIIYTPSDEFKVLVRDTCKKYKTYGFNIPLPLHNDKFPFLAKATLCYFPWCSRRFGVDYTLTELDLHFGRMTETSIKSIDNNKQGDAGAHKLYEDDMKKEFRKWDCVKHVSEGIKPRSTGKSVIVSRDNEKPKKPYAGWGFSLLKKQRFDNELVDRFSIPNAMPFSLVMTFKSVDNRNRMDDFIRFAKLNNWEVNTIDADFMAEVHEKGEAELDFSE